ncbi:MAG: ABC transporter permease [Oscillospiraceae bacterium]|nr:ABC transporter permease [Oscillospiraceae bacterium]
MSVFSKFTLKSLVANKTRTLVTIIGITLSIALFTAVLECAYSGIKYVEIINDSIYGKYHGVHNCMTEHQVKEIIDDKEVNEFSVLEHIGYAKVDENHSKVSRYHLLKSIDDNFESMTAINIISGRMPQKNDEIILSEVFFKDIFDVGDKIELCIGQKNDVVSGNKDSGDFTEKTYIVVGLFYEYHDEFVDLEDKYLFINAYTKGEQGNGTNDMYISLVNKKNISEYEKRTGDDKNFEKKDSEYTIDRGVQTTVYGMTIILISLICFGSVSLIYNAFAISVTERIKQYGMLRSVGATGRQIRYTVFFEAFVLNMISVLPGILIGCGGSATVLYMIKDMLKEGLAENISGTINFVFNPYIILISVLLSIITIMISVILPAVRAVKADPIASIRGTNDIKSSNKKIKTTAFSKKHFSFSAMMALKNFRRNRKRYRIVVMSLSMSIILFVSSSSFVSYLNDIVATPPTYIFEREDCKEDFDTYGELNVLGSFFEYEDMKNADIDDMIKVLDEAINFVRDIAPDTEVLEELIWVKKDAVHINCLISVVEILCYGFIIIITLISVANVFNTITTNVNLRRREYAMLKSVGLSDRGLGKILNYECIFYGVKSLIIGLPISVAITYVIYIVSGAGYDVSFYIPLKSIIGVCIGIFPVVFLPMFYSRKRIKNENCVDELRNENI